MAYVESNNWTMDAAFLAANNVTRETLASSPPAGEVLNTLLRVQARYEQSQQDEDHGAFADDLEGDVADDDNEGEPKSYCFSCRAAGGGEAGQPASQCECNL